MRTALEDILSHDQSFEDFEVRHEFPSIGIKRMILNGRRMGATDETRDLILLAIEDVTNMK